MIKLLMNMQRYAILFSGSAHEKKSLLFPCAEWQMYSLDGIIL
jgi:hypothetical protein